MNWVTRVRRPAKPVFRYSLLALSIAATAQWASADLLQDLTGNERNEISVELPAGVQYFGFDMAALPHNEFAVVWAEHVADDDPDTENHDRIRLQKYSGDGKTLGPVKTLFAYSDATVPWRPQLAVDKAGNMVVAWGETQLIGSVEGVDPALQGTLLMPCSLGTVGLYGTGMRAARMLASGVIEKVSIAGAGIENDLCDLKVAMDEDGDFALLWALGVELHHTNLQMQTFTAEGQAITAGSVIQVGPSFLPGDLTFSMNDQIIVARSELLFDKTGVNDIGSRIVGQRFGLDGKEIGPPLLLDSGTEESTSYGYHRLASLASLPDTQGDGFLTVWSENDATTFQNGREIRNNLLVRMRRWGSGGIPSDNSPLVLGEYNNLDNCSCGVSTPSIDIDTDGNLFGAWAIDFFDSISDGSELTANVLSVLTMDDTQPAKQFSLHYYDYVDAALLDFQTMKFAVNDQSIAMGWLDGDPVSIDGSNRFSAVIAPGLVEPKGGDDDQRVKSGSLGGLALLITLCLGLRRWWR